MMGDCDMKIFVMSEGMYWQVELEEYAPFWKDMIMIEYYRPVKKYSEKITRINCRNELHNMLGSDIMAGFNSYKYRILLGHSEEINNLIDDGEDVIVLGDIEPSSILIMKLLQNIDKKINLHLWAIMPFRFEGKKKRKVFNELLSDLNGIKSVALYEAESAMQVVGMDFDTVNQCFACVAYDVMERLPTYLNQVKKLGNKAFFYDFRYDKFFETKESFFGWRNEQNALNPINAESQDMDVKKEELDNSVICRMFPRNDGHEVCKTLKEMRMAFAKVNGIPFKTERCTFKGPCAGTCAACDREVAYLEAYIKENNMEEIIFPQKTIEEPDGKGIMGRSYITTYRDFTMGLDYSDNSTIIIPDFLK